MKKVLIITYYWPPGSGAGVQRWLKFSKYLPESGWEPVILTVDPEYATYPATDKSMEAEISPDLKIFKTRATDYFRVYSRDKNKIPSAGFASNNDSGIKSKFLRFVRGNFFIPDPRKGWNKYAFKKACELIGNGDINHIITTSPPHSTQLIGLKLKKKYPGIKWIADLRDPWTDIYYYDQFYPTFLSKTIDRKFEHSILLSADKIITVGKSLKDLFSKKLPGIKDKIEIISNGFDEDDFNGLNSTDPEKFTVSYIGTLSDSYPIKGFLDAINSIKEKGTDVCLKFVGTISPKQKELILSRVDESAVEFIHYVDHKAAIRYMLETTLLLLIIPDHQSNKSILTGKLFEYIASGKAVICVGPVKGDAADILEIAGNGKTFNYTDIEGMAVYLENLILNPDNSKKSENTLFSRRNLTRVLSGILGSI
jgi:glycosyltransferase involved in cell wall biosynthesis